MGIGGVRGLTVDLQVEKNVPVIDALFNEELGIVVEVAQSNVSYVLEEYKKNGVIAKVVGVTGGYGMLSEVNMFDFNICSYFLPSGLN